LLYYYKDFEVNIKGGSNEKEKRRGVCADFRPIEMSLLPGRSGLQQLRAAVRNNGEKKEKKDK
jgi:hypothetical protein